MDGGWCRWVVMLETWLVARRFDLETWEAIAQESFSNLTPAGTPPILTPHPWTHYTRDTHHPHPSL